jgi:hypothetical protein
MHIPAFPEDIKYYSYNVEVIGAGTINGYRTGEKLYIDFDSADGTGKSYFHVLIQNANANNGNGQVSVYYSKSIQETMSNLVMADNTKIDTGENGLELLHLNQEDPGSGAKIIISSSPAIDIFANLTGNSYTLSETQRLDEPIIEEYNHFTTYMEFKQPRLKNVKIILNVEYEDNINTNVVEVNIRQAVADVFKITPYFIGQNIPINKIWKAVQSVENIKRFSVAYPLEDITCEDNELLILHDSDLVIKEIVPTVYK